ncbi:hypothetical protein D9757_013257 [Collybiopsis confluens]|uniref:Uncharacterized protein n=1 Tax=Collybiopsis confluens TaxID=2823264 RepID=A0A8H5GQL8_9AGAR|nr:hypothetical protein D9757_013257 [Collybiopsis confluens]
MNPLRSTPEIDIPGTLGSLVVGVQFNAFLYGLCLLQLVTYFTSGARDRLAIRLMIVWVLFIDTAITAMSLYMLWEYVVANFSNEAYMLTGRHITYPPALTALGACPIQIFLAYRVKRLSGSWVVFTVLVLLTITEILNSRKSLRRRLHDDSGVDDTTHSEARFWQSSIL